MYCIIYATHLNVFVITIRIGFYRACNITHVIMRLICNLFAVFKIQYLKYTFKMMNRTNVKYDTMEHLKRHVVEISLHSFSLLDT